MVQFEIEEKNGGYPPVDGHIRLDVRVTKHTLNINGVHFNYKVVDANKMKV